MEKAKTGFASKLNIKEPLMKKSIYSLLSCCVLLTACGSLDIQNAATYAKNEEFAERKIAEAKAVTNDAKARRIASENVSTPYIAGNSTELAREASIPPQLRRDMRITANYANVPVDFPLALQQIANSSGLVITATPDALMSPSAFSMKNGTSATNGTATAANSNTGTPKVMVRASDTPIWMVLDNIAAQSSTQWRTTSSGIEFFRLVTQTYDLMTIAATAEAEAGMNKTADKTGSTSKTNFKATASSQLDGIKTIVDSLLTTGGKYTLSTENQTLVVTDTGAAQERIATFIKKQNKAMARRVRVVVEAIDVTSNQDSQLGFDWNIIYNTTKGALSVASPNSTTSTNTGTMNFGIMNGKFSGSGLVLSALSNIGTVTNRRVFPFITTSGRPITQALRTTFSYVDQVQTPQMSGGTLVSTTTTAPTVSQKTETVGTFLTLIPTAKPDGTIFISSSLDTSTADPLQPFTVGSGSTAVTVQQITTHGNGSVQEVPVYSGRTEIIGGLEISSANNNKRTLGENAPLIAGGSNVSTSNKTVTILLVTATVEDGI